MTVPLDRRFFVLRSPPPCGSLKRKEAEYEQDTQQSRPGAIHGQRTMARHGINRNWLLDEIAIIQPHDQGAAAEEFQVRTLVVTADKGGTLTCDDGNGNIFYTKEIESTDFAAGGTSPFTSPTIRSCCNGPRPVTTLMPAKY